MNLMECHGNMRKKLFFTFIFLIIIVGLIYSLYNNKRNQLYTDKIYLMDTLVEIKVSSEHNAKNTVQETFNIMEEWEKKLDRYNENSIIAEINSKGENGVYVSSELITFFQKVVKYAKMTEGAFDPTIAPLIDLWGFGEGENGVPEKAEIEQALKLIDYNNIKIDEKAQKIYLPKKQKIDLGAVAKGFIIDKAYEFLKKEGLNNFFINAGGNIRVSGINKIENRPWTIGIRKVRNNNEIYNNYILEITDGAIATSGDYERYFIKNNKRYSHLIDSRTGYPARGIQGITIYAPDAFTADILSTANFILGWDKAKNHIKNSAGIAGFIVRKGEIWYSDNFKEFFAKK